VHRYLAAAVVCLAVGSLGSEALSACGDKFLLLGRGIRFQRAYAAIHPARILLVVPSKSVKVAAVRDPRLKSALSDAGHKVDVVPAAKLAQALANGPRYDLILAGRADAVGIPASLPAGAGKPSVIGVLEDSGGADLAAGRLGLDAMLKTPQPLPDILRVLDDVMTARRDRARAAAF
jgi:hypothetical protein